MARSRNIKPGFFKNADLVDLPAFTRLLFAGLWCLADREGRLEDRPKQIKLEILPADNCDVEEMLVTLATRGFIERYEVDGHKYINLPNFHKHQKPHFKEISSTIPPPKPQPRQVLAPTQVVADHDLGCGLPLPRSVLTTTQVVASPADSLNLIPDVLIPDSLNLIPDCPPKRREVSLDSSDFDATSGGTLVVMSPQIVEPPLARWLDLKKIYWAAGKPWPETQEQQLFQRYTSLDEPKQVRLIDFVKRRLMDGTWSDPKHTKSLSNLLAGADYDVPEIQRTLPAIRGQTRADVGQDLAARAFLAKRGEL